MNDLSGTEGAAGKDGKFIKTIGFDEVRKNAGF